MVVSVVTGVDVTAVVVGTTGFPFVDSIECWFSLSASLDIGFLPMGCVGGLWTTLLEWALWLIQGVAT